MLACASEDQPRETMAGLHLRPALSLLIPLLLLPPAAARAVPKVAGVPQTKVVTKEAGIDFTYTFGDHEMSNIVEGTGAGCSWFDYDGDGRIDLYLANGATLAAVNDWPASRGKAPKAVNRLYRNLGGGRFADVTAKAGVGDPRYSVQAVAGDYDNDGDSDLYVTNYGRNSLYRNDGSGTFSDVTAQAGVGDELYGLGATWLDADNDGDLDLYVSNYLEFDKGYRLYYEADVFPGPLAYPGQYDVFYRNDGDGTFADVTARVKGLSTVKGRGMGVVAADFTGDGLPDLFVANDAMENFLYLNRGGWTFEETALVAGVAYSASGNVSASMGGDAGDIDRDGRLDLVVPDMAFNNVYLNRGDAVFEDVTSAVGVAEASGQYWSWGIDLFDLDNDGDRDLAISNGHGHRITETQESLLLAKVVDERGEPRFVDVGPQSGPFWLQKMIARGLCTADYDDDGDTDLFFLTLDRPSILLRNDLGAGNHWLRVVLQGTRGNRDGYGARVTVKAGNLVLTEEKLAASSFVSQNDPRLLFGLGTRSRIDRVEVSWPSGAVQRVERPKVDATLTLREPAK